MDLSSSPASTLARPRLTLAIISAVAAVTVGVYMFYEASTASHNNPHGLHRSNAVRRRRRPSGHSRRESLASTTSAESQADHDEENIEVDLDERAAAIARLDRLDTDAGDMTDDHFGWGDETPQRAGQNIVSLLFRVSEDNARRNAYVHRGCACNACGIVPIRGIRYRCANCADFDLCETCESQGMHIKTHIFYKVKIPAPPFGPRQMQPVFYTGDPDTCLRNLPRALMNKLSRETGYERPELEAFWEQWTFIANTEWREDPDDLGLAMDRKTFERCLVPSGGYRHTSPNLLHDRMFAFYDTNNDDLIGFTEFIHGLSYNKRGDKLKRIFNGYDIDGDGFVDRKDFLRLFRAHYVLFKQMHKDILEGLDDQVMSSTEAHQLVTSRQPLSSLFGREGRVPAPDQDRAMDGKVFYGNGETALTGENRGVVSEDKPDRMGREEVLSALFNPGSPQPLFESLFSPATNDAPSPQGATGTRYFDILLNPPRNTQDLQAVIVDDPRSTIDSFLHHHDERHGIDPDEGFGVRVNDENAEGAGTNSNGQGGSAGAAWHQDGVGVLNETENGIRAQFEGILDEHDHRQRLIVTRKSRIAARKKLYERWTRRQFYLDEEEGAHAPEGWNAKDDVLANASANEYGNRNGHGIDAAVGGKTAHHPQQRHDAQPLSPRSRSSSKVRFVEDTDDFDVRSNPSTSSRSIPERWGGMEIPDAERDAGKEILYQITQQAFNELLDVLFKKKEDLAIRAASTKADRNRYRKLFEHIDLDEEDGKKPQAADDPTATTAPAEEEKESREAASRASSRNASDNPFTALHIAHESDEDNARSGPRGDNPPAPTPAAVRDSNLSGPEGTEEGAASSSSEPAASSSEPAASSSELAATSAEEHRDPTMPQFMPNSSEEARTRNLAGTGPGIGTGTYGLPPAETDTDTDINTDTDSDSEQEPEIGSKPRKSDAENQKDGGGCDDDGDDGDDDDDDDGVSRHGSDTEAPSVPHPMLVEWKRLDVAEQDSRTRGGWGKLCYEEFEEIYRREERLSSRLDYLGSWIDFCIPY